MNKELTFFVVTILLFFSCGKMKSVKNFHENKTWVSIESSDNSKPVARHEAAFVKVKNSFYLLGGRGIRSVSIFDVETQKWKQGKKPPLEFHHFQPVVYNGNIYIIGALTGKYPSETPVENIYIYNPKKDSWTKGGEIPKERLRGSTGNVIKDDVVYISCGIKDGHRSDHKKWLDSYNLKTREWKVLPNAPRARDHFQAVELDNKIYVAAGRLSKAPKATWSETIGEVDVYDIKKQKWSTIKNNIPTQRAGNMALAYGKNILIIGGESEGQTKAHNEVEALNTKTLQWSKYPSLLRGRHGTGVFLFKNEIYIASGCGNKGGSPELTSTEKY